jgi:hypothetical protein
MFINQLNSRKLAPAGYYFCLLSLAQLEYVSKLDSFEIKDMLHCVWQWCLNWYAPYLNNEPINDMSVIYKVLRGGSFMIKKSQCRSAVRNYEEPSRSLKDAGFRIALVRTGITTSANNSNNRNL